MKNGTIPGRFMKHYNFFYILVEAILLFSGSKIGHKITKKYKIIIYKSEVVKLQISEFKFKLYLHNLQDLTGAN